MPRRRSNRNAGAIKVKTSADSSRMSRPRRTVSGADPVSMATVSRNSPSQPSLHSLRLTVKLPASKLREATGGAQPSRGPGRISIGSRERFVGGEILEGKRPRNVRKSYVLDSDSDDEEEEEEEDEEMEDVGEEEDADGESVEEDDDMDAEGEEDAEPEEDEEDADGDIDIDVPPPPIIKVSKAEKRMPTITVRPAGRSDSKTVEQKEVAAISDDEELSDLDSDMEVEEEEGMQLGDEEDAEGEDEEIDVGDDEEEEEEDDDDDLDSDDETPGGGSRASTPDITKLTKRQRARLEEGGSGHLLALPDEVQVKKHLTAEEHAMRRAEMARRRKNLSEKRNEEEKMETINKLLKKQAPKTNARRRDFNGLNGPDSTPDGEPPKANSLYVRWISNRDGNQIGVPEEWVEGPSGALFTGAGITGGTLIEEVQ